MIRVQTSKPPVLQARGLTVERGRRILDAIDLDVRSAEVTMLMGANGAGKSTLLSVLSGDLAATTGEVRLHDKPLSDWRSRDLAQLRGMLPQRAGLSVPFLASEVVRLGCWSRTEDRQATESVVKSALVATGAIDLADRSMQELSGGEQARVHLARVLAQIWRDSPAEDGRQPCLLLDEPCASLDPAHQHSVCATVRDFARASGAAVVMSMHDVNLAAQYADRLLILHNGHLAHDGTPQQVLQQPSAAACFDIGIACWNPGAQRPVAATHPAS